MTYKSKREFLELGYSVSEETEQMRQQILATDELFLTEQETKQQEDE